MASLSIARPGKVSERQYLGDLTILFERQRKRSGLALTLDSFASDLAGSDALRSGLFTLCNAISHMGESDLSAEELLGLVARALGGGASAEGDTSSEIPPDMRAAFLTGYEAWRNRDLQRIVDSVEPEIWPPPSPAARKPPMSEPGGDAFARNELAVGAGNAEPTVTAAGRRTVQEALSLVRRERAQDAEHLESPLAGVHADDLGRMTLGELKRILEEIEGRVSRLGPHIQQLSSAAREPARRERERSPSLPDSVIPFPARHNRMEEKDDDSLYSSDSDVESFARRRPIPAPNLRAEDTFLAQASETDERPRGIDALVAAAPAWASAVPTSRVFSEDAFLARHAYLAPSRRPGSEAPASIHHAEPPAQILAPPVAALPTLPAAAALDLPAPDAILPPATTLADLDADDEPLSPIERIQNFVLGLSPRRVFLSLAGLTVFAGGLAGVIAYRTLHTDRVPQFKDLESAPHLGTPADTPPAPAEAATTVTAPLAESAPAETTSAPAVAARAKITAAAAESTRSKSHAALRNVAPAGVWPALPQTTSQQSEPPGTSSTGAAGPLYVPASTMIGYVLASPQPVYPVGVANGVSGTVSVAVTVSRTGIVTSDHAVSGPAELRPAAVAAVRGWRFRPFLVGGTPTEVTTTLEFYFKGD
ncbi:MAG TPA: energy transducer TonB [Acidobacteriaceae bacterium]|nr:energy transducer TonB [Acidobacteriaceae bacterium]